MLLGTTLPRDAGVGVAPQGVIVAVVASWVAWLAPVLDPPQGLIVGQTSERVHAASVQAKWTRPADDTRGVFLGNRIHHCRSRLLTLVAATEADDTRMMALTPDLVTQLSVLAGGCDTWLCSAMGTL
eukprot:COSAG01_NODE_43622_length_428_cov_0.528875_1_plen_126_part_01